MITTMTIDEAERPTEWLRRLEEDGESWRRLLTDAGSFARAAWRLAHARCRAHSLSSRVPTEREVRAAATDLATRTSERSPAPVALLEECRLASLPVLAPLAPRRAA